MVARATGGPSARRRAKANVSSRSASAGQTDRLARRLAALPRAAVVAAKRLLAASADSTLEAALAAELEAQVDLLGGADFRAALDRRKEAAGAR
jgi:enoyl-CoA hydratase/carnithine racemase